MPAERSTQLHTALPLPRLCATPDIGHDAKSLAGFASFSPVADLPFAQLAREATRQRYKAGEHIWYAGDAAAHFTLIILRVRAAAVLRLMREHLPLSLAVNQALLQHNAALRASLEIVGAGAVPKRLAVLFLSLGRRFGAMDGGGAQHIEMALTREQIGRLVGARVETVIRIISRWQKAAWMKNARGGMEITRVDMLQRVVDAG